MNSLLGMRGGQEQVAKYLDCGNIESMSMEVLLILLSYSFCFLYNYGHSGHLWKHSVINYFSFVFDIHVQLCFST